MERLLETGKTVLGSRKESVGRLAEPLVVKIVSPWAEVCGIAVSMLEGDQSVPTGAIPERSSRGGRGKEERGDNGSCERTSQEKGFEGGGGERRFRTR